MRTFPVIPCTMLALTLLLCACHGLEAIGPKDISGKPTVYATVNTPPDPLLVGCYVRIRPSEYNRPNKYEFCLIKDVDRYALYYYIMNGKSLATFKDWTPAVINGTSITAEYDGSQYFVKDGEVWQMTTTGGPHRMMRMR